MCYMLGGFVFRGTAPRVAGESYQHKGGETGECVAFHATTSDDLMFTPDAGTKSVGFATTRTVTSIHRPSI